MYIKSITLKNFRLYEEIKINFNEKLSVIVGGNGAGKTTVMEGIAIALSTLFIKMDGLSSKNIDKSQVRLKSFSVGSTTDMQAQYPVVISAEAAVYRNNKYQLQNSCHIIEWTRSLNSSTGQTAFKNAQSATKLGMDYQQYVRNGDDEFILPIFGYYGTGRLWDYHREKKYDVFKANNRLNGYIDCMDGTANIKLMMNWFSKMTVEKYQRQELGLSDIPELEAVFNAMEICYKRITGFNNVKIQYNMGSNELEVVYKDESGDLVRIPINLLSDGYKSTISLIADIAYRMAVLNPQLLGDVCKRTNGIIMIDEIDLHLHPIWQQRIIGDLQYIFPNVQFIVSTHAPSVISTVKSENIIMLENGDAFTPAGEVHGRDANTIVSSLMNASERPKELKCKFESFYSFVNKKDFDEAEKKLNEIKSIIGEDDPEISTCNIKLALLNARRGK